MLYFSSCLENTYGNSRNGAYLRRFSVSGTVRKNKTKKEKQNERTFNEAVT